MASSSSCGASSTCARRSGSPVFALTTVPATVQSLSSGGAGDCELAGETACDAPCAARAGWEVDAKKAHDANTNKNSSEARRFERMARAAPQPRGMLLPQLYVERRDLVATAKRADRFRPKFRVGAAFAR